MLRKQKQSLIQVIQYFEDTKVLNSRVREDLEGILNWLDFIQDVAADAPDGLGSDKVFGIVTL